MWIKTLVFFQWIRINMYCTEHVIIKCFRTKLYILNDSRFFHVLFLILYCSWRRVQRINCTIFLLQNYWVSRRSIQEIEMSSQQGNFQHDQISGKAGVVITSFRQSQRRFVWVFLMCLSVYIHMLLYTSWEVSMSIDLFSFSDDYTVYLVYSIDIKNL